MVKIYDKIKNFIKNIHKRFTEPSFIRVYSYDSLPKEITSFYGHSNKININDKKLLEKLYHHILTSSKIYYYCEEFCSGIDVYCSVGIEKFGWCFLKLFNNLCVVEFIVLRSNTVYKCSKLELKKYMPLYKFLKDFYEKANKEYQNDKNL